MSLVTPDCDRFLFENFPLLQNDLVRSYQFREAWRDNLKRFKIGTSTADLPAFVAEQRRIGEHLISQVSPAAAPLELTPGSPLAHAAFSDAVSITDDPTIAEFRRKGP